MNKGQKDFLRERMEEAKKEQPKIVDLQKRLLAIDGKALVPAQGLEELTEVKKILKDGKLFHPCQTKMMKGEPSHCHENILLLWDVNREELTPCTGYALSPDGLWRSHSWALTKKGAIVETTEKRKAYYGICYTKKEAEKQLSEVLY